MFDQERGQSLSVVWSVLLSLAQPVNQDDGEAAGDLSLLVQEAERLEDPELESLSRVCVAAVNGDDLSLVLV